MNITNSVGQPVNFGSQPASTISHKPNTPSKESVRLLDGEINDKKTPNKQAPSNIVVDEQAIASYQQSQASALSSNQSNNNAVSFDKPYQQSATGQDQPSAKNETAVASYQAVGNLAQRESVQKLLGVDLFA